MESKGKLITHSFNMRQAVEKLNAGEVIIYPTEAIYGIGCEPLDQNAVFHLLKLKQRDVAKGLILIASSLEQLEPYLLLDDEMRQRLNQSWPGAVTWVVPAQSWVPDWLTGGHNSLAVRVTAHPVASKLCESYGSALVSTSVNISTRPAAKSRWAVRKYFSDQLHIVSGELGGLKQATPIYKIEDSAQLR